MLDAAPLSFWGLLQGHHEQAAFHQQRFIARRFSVRCLDVLDGGNLRLDGRGGRLDDLSCPCR